MIMQPLLKNFSSKSVVTEVCSPRSIIAQLPTVLYYQIIDFYTNEYKGLYHLRTISKEWKAAAETSVVWLRCPLISYCPKEYLRPLLNDPALKGQTLEALYSSLKNLRFQTRIKYFGLFEDFEETQNYYCGVRCDEGGLRMMPVAEHTETPLPFQILNRSNNQFEESAKVFHWFNSIHSYYQRKWQNRIENVSKIDRYYIWFRDTVRGAIMNELTSVLALTVLSMYGWYTIENNVAHSKMSWENHLSFACLYMICILGAIMAVFELMMKQCHQFLLSIDLSAVFWDRVCFHIVNDSLILLFVCVLVSFVLVHLIVVGKSERSSISFPWSMVLIPIWLWFGTTLLFRIANVSEMKKQQLFELFLMACFALSVTLLTNYYDDASSVQYSFGVAILPLLPFVILVTVFLVVQIATAASNLRRFRIKSKRNVLLNAGSLLSSITAFGTMVLLWFNSFLFFSGSPLFLFAVFCLAMICMGIFEMSLLNSVAIFT